jgi:hypothetical protein
MWQWELSTDLYLVPELQMSGTVPSGSNITFIVMIGTTLTTGAVSED